MLYQVLLFTAGAALLFSLGLVIYTAIICRLALWKFKKASRGLPMVHGQSILGNGAITLAMRKNICSYIMEEKHKYDSKTVGWLYRTKPCVITYDLDLMKKIMDDPDNHINRTDTLHLPLPELEEGIMLAEDDQWRRLRRSFAPAVKGTRLKSLNVVSEIESSIDKLVTLIEEKLADKKKVSPDGGRLVKMDDLAHRYSMDLVFSCLYKQPDIVNFDERPCKWAEMVDAGFGGFQSSPVVHASIVFPILRPVVEWLIYHFDQQGVWRREIMGFIKRQTRLGFQARKELQELKAAGVDVDPHNFTLKDGTKFRRNMLDYVIDHFLDGKLAKDEFFNTSFLLINAAEKTSVDAITHMLYQIAVNPEIQERLRKSITEHGVESEYLSWVINESLRLRPPASIGCTRKIGHDIEIENGKYLLPKGTTVVTPAWPIQRLPEIWGDDAEVFKPERWKNASQFHPLQFIPFGYGPRGCLGKEFALLEMKNLMAVLLTRYKFEAEIKDDLHIFDAPLLLTNNLNSPTYITIKKLQGITE